MTKKYISVLAVLFLASIAWYFLLREKIETEYRIPTTEEIFEANEAKELIKVELRKLNISEEKIEQMVDDLYRPENRRINEKVFVDPKRFFYQKEENIKTESSGRIDILMPEVKAIEFCKAMKLAFPYMSEEQIKDKFLKKKGNNWLVNYDAITQSLDPKVHANLFYYNDANSSQSTKTNGVSQP